MRPHYQQRPPTANGAGQQQQHAQQQQHQQKQHEQHQQQHHQQQHQHEQHYQQAGGQYYYQPPFQQQQNYYEQQPFLQQQQPHQQSHQQSHQPQQQQQQQNYFATAPSFIPVNNSPFEPASYPLAAQMGLQLGTQAISAGQEYVNKNLDRWFSRDAIRAYFQVSNSYVLNKLLLLCFPFRHSNWQRQVNRSEVTGQIEGFKTPVHDINAPDLYIPTMAIITYILLVGLAHGIRDTFQPDLLGYTASKVAVLIFLELLLVKLGGYIFSVSSDISLLSILALIGYNYVALIGSLGADVILGKWGKYGVFAYMSLAMAFFMLRTLRHAVLNDAQQQGYGEHRRRRVNFLFIIVSTQILSSFFLLQ